MVPRPEYPRPQFQRKNWINLNGTWEFEMDSAQVGREKEWYKQAHLAGSIQVPFCPESKLSGVGCLDFMNAVWYKKRVEVPKTWREGRILLWFGAVDYYATVWVNGNEIGQHTGGYTPFCVDVTGYAPLLEITVCAQDDVRSGRQPAGKQSERLHSYGCLYTRTTGIWQTVWLEHVPEVYIKQLKMTPQVESQSVHLEVGLSQMVQQAQLQVEACYEGEPMGNREISVNGRQVSLDLPLKQLHLWDTGQGRLYGLHITFQSKYGADEVDSYFGMRSISWDDRAFYLNGRPVFQRLVLDQGFYPDGIYTAPEEEALKTDIMLSMQMGFNGARMHEKVFEPRYLYWADRLGYLLWGEYPNWQMDISQAHSTDIYLPQWLESVQRDYNSPALIGWCPFNETWDYEGHKQNDDTLRNIYWATKAVDPTRPVIDTSGNYHVITDFYDIHDYTQDPGTFAQRYAPLREGGEPFESFPQRQHYQGQPFWISEYGGIAWEEERREDGWGYGDRPKGKEEFLQRYRELTQVLLSNPNMMGFCYTQLYDVEQEINGLYTYSRIPKFNPEAIRAINSQRAAIERYK